MTNAVMEQKHEKLLQLNETKSHITSIDGFRANPSGKLKAEVDIHGIENPGVEGFVGMWLGSNTIPSAMNDFLGVTRVSDVADKTVKLEITKPGHNFPNDRISIGLFLVNDNLTTLAACMVVDHGVQGELETSTLFVPNGQTSRFLNVHYQVPHYVTPHHNRDYICLFKGSDIDLDHNKALKQIHIQSNQSSGNISIPVSDIMMEGPFIVEYFSGRSTWNAVNSAFSFVV